MGCTRGLDGQGRGVGRLRRRWEGGIKLCLTGPQIELRKRGSRNITVLSAGGSGIGVCSDVGNSGDMSAQY